MTAEKEEEPGQSHPYCAFSLSPVPGIRVPWLQLIAAQPLENCVHIL